MEIHGDSWRMSSSVSKPFTSECGPEVVTKASELVLLLVWRCGRLVNCCVLQYEPHL